MRCLTALLLVAGCLAAAADVPAAAADNSTLVLVHVLFRHGQRTPVLVCPTDPNADTWLARGLGQLTNAGKSMQYELGQFLRKRYGGFLNPRYHMNYTAVRSSDVDRTLMSAQANLAGLYPPVGEDVWNKNLTWQPIPVHTEPVTEDLLLSFMEACARYAKELRRVMATPELRKVEDKNRALYDFVSKECGSEIRDLQKLILLYDMLLIESEHNMKLPAWATAELPPYNRTVYPALLRPMNELAFRLLSYDQTLKRLGGGALLADMVAHLHDKVSDALQPPNRQLFMYSGHDADIAALLGALGAYNNIPPPLASALLLELHRDRSGSFFVQLLYRNDTGRDPYLLRLPNCTASCPWEAFRDLTAPVRPADGVRECEAHSGTPTGIQATVIGLAVTLALLLVLCAIGAVVFARRRRMMLAYSHFGEVEG